MIKINWHRVVLGGLLAGVTLNLTDSAFHWITQRGDWWFFKALAHPLAQAAAIAPHIGLHFAFGIAAIWLYAATRPRFGAGPKTAILVGLAFWVIGDVLPTLGWADLLATHPWLEGASASRWVIASFVELGEFVLATLVGAWVYSESAAT